MDSKKEEKVFPYEINEKAYERFDQKNNMIYRRMWDKSISTYGKMFHTNINHHISSGKSGYTRFDFAFVKAGWTVYEKFPFAFSWKNEETFKGDYGVNWTKEKYKIKNLNKFTQKVKQVARYYGASLVGITKVNEKWLYKTGFVRPENKSEENSKGNLRDGKNPNSLLSNPIELPDGIDKAIVMAIEMDSEAIATAPAQPAAAAASIAYSKMAFAISCLGEFIRNLGYRAIQCGNDTALSIPMAIEAGLGALGRNGLLITEDFGPRVRICKVFTDLPLEIDLPNVEFAKKINKFCKKCLKCAEECENGAISEEIEPFWNPKSISNNKGVKKYYVDVEKCFEFWIENSSDCGTCIAVCPYSRVNESLMVSEFWK